VIAIGDTAPGFDLPGTDGNEQTLQTPAVVVFTCNHCPYALAWHDRLMDLARDYADVHFYAINPNDAERYPRDSFEAMRERVERDGGWPMPYLRDESQDVAHAYGAKTTPDVFVVDPGGELRYRGAPDADHDDPGQNAAWLREALDAVLAGEEVARPETEPVGCSVKWK
jgi:peroxiredoxin